MGGFLTFRIGEPQSELQGAPLGGGRYPVEVLLAGKSCVRFHIDVGFGDPLIGAAEQLTGDTVLDFIGIAPVKVMAIPKAQQFAEKVHAYTFPWADRMNRRTKDLVDLILFIRSYARRSRGDIISTSETLVISAGRNKKRPPTHRPGPFAVQHRLWLKITGKPLRAFHG